MSIAYGFEPDVSPIYENDDDNPDKSHSVHFSSADTPRRTGRPSSRHQRTMGASRMFDESSFHDFHQECAPSGLEESENVPESNFLESSSDEVVPDSKDGREEAEEEDEVVPDSTGFLSDTFIVLSAGCCIPIRQHLTKCLVEMGASMQSKVDHRTTHVVVDRYADESIVADAMSRRPLPPLMVDVKWIQECVDRREKCEEADYSMRDCRYLKQTCRRLSSYREPTPEDESIQWEEEGPEDPAELLKQIRKLSERLDALLDYVPIIRFEYHSPDCPTRQRPIQFTQPAPELSPRRQNLQKTQNLENLFKTGSQPIRRRRSFTGFCLEHREPENQVLQVHLENRDERKTWQKPKKGKKQKKPPRNTQKTPKTKKNSKKPAKKRPKPVPVRADDSDIQSALASLTITDPRHQPELQKLPNLNPELSRISRTSNSVEILEIRRREPLIVTKSAFINRLQCHEDSRDDDFISDVSAFRMTQKQQKRGQKEAKNASAFQESRRNRDLEEMREEEEEEDPKNGVVFTGFGKSSSIEKKLKTILRRFKLQPSTELDPTTTRCVVSRHGKRTLLVLKALCLDIPVVRPQWLEESFEDSQLLPHSDYIFPEWALDLPQNRRQIFSRFLGKFWISEKCTPEKSDLCWMIEQCGGKITRKIQRAEFIIAPENWQKNLELPDGITDEILEEVPICTPLFIIDSISKAEEQEISDYLIEN